ncbi:LOW QUALITY PROTEIN: hypothetical protein U9M48_014273 [Paspalum notatum var. saurae]|uniref:Reverse transcriptase Ty1/copia-type domain-containing protein n=1 Tax=Paspalum notatum var. saurae TaxID=547442 RepID=A0AAQ3T1N8_PASNO
MDVKNAFLHGTLHPTRLDMVNKSLYGLKHSRFATFLVTLGFTEAKSTPPCLSIGMEMRWPICSMLMTSSSQPPGPSLLRRIITSLQREFAMKDLGVLHHFLGVTVEPRPSAFSSTSGGTLLTYRSVRGWLIVIPVPPRLTREAKLSEDAGPPPILPPPCRCFAHLTFTMGSAVRLHMHDPREPHQSPPLQRRRGCPDTRRSTSGYAVFLGGNLVSWSSKRRPVVSRSNAEAEYRAVANGRFVLAELHGPLAPSTLVYRDNVGAVYLSTNPVQHQRTKHVEIDLHFVRDRVAIGDVRVLHVPTTSQFADIFTKGLPSAVFSEFRSSLNIARG